MPGRRGEGVERPFAVRCGRWTRRIGLRHPLLQDDVRVGAAEPEGAHARASHGAAVPRPDHRPLPVLGDQPERRALESQVGVGVLQVQQRGQFAVLHGEQDLQHARDARRGLQVADGGLDGADSGDRFRRHREPALGVQGAEGLLQALDLHGITEPGARAVGLDVADRVRFDVRLTVRADHHLGLCPRTGCRQGGGAPRVVHGAAPDDGVDVVAVGQGPAQRLQQQRPGPLASYVTVGARVERPAPSLGAQHARLCEGDEDRGAERHVDPADESRVALSRPHRAHRPVQRDQRAGAGGVHGLAGTAQVQQVGDPVGDDGVGDTRGHVGLGRHAVRGEQFVVVGGRHAHEHARAGPRQVVGAPAGVLEGPPHDLEEQALLRVHERGLAGRYPEQAGVEGGDVVQEPGPYVAGARIGEQVEAVLGDRGDQVVAGGQVRPEGVQVR